MHFSQECRRTTLLDWRRDTTWLLLSSALALWSWMGAMWSRPKNPFTGSQRRWKVNRTCTSSSKCPKVQKNLTFAGKWKFMASRLQEGLAKLMAFNRNSKAGAHLLGITFPDVTPSPFLLPAPPSNCADSSSKQTGCKKCEQGYQENIRKHTN